MAAIFISGAARGLGSAIAADFAARGAQVHRGVQVPANPGDIELNVRSIPSCEAAIAAAAGAGGGLDILVNNAGIHLAGAVAALDQDAFKETLDVNLLGVWRLTRAAIPFMRPGGTIAMISSLSGIVGLPGDGAYAASKFALEGLGQSLAAEVAPLGLRVLLFEPGRIATGFAGATGGMAARDAAAAIVEAILAPGTSFRTPVGDDAARLFEAVGVDRGARSEAVVRAVTGRDWQPSAPAAAEAGA